MAHIYAPINIFNDDFPAQIKFKKIQCINAFYVLNKTYFDHLDFPILLAFVHFRMDWAARIHTSIFYKPTTSVNCTATCSPWQTGTKKRNA